MKTKNNDEVEEIRYCKKCGCELASTNRHKLCENCRRSRNKKIREWAVGGLGAIGIIIFAGKNLGELRDNTSSDDSNVDNDNDSNESDSDDSYSL